MFIDSVEITVASGKGGPGCVAFRREKYVINGGPNGGDGGRGGDIVFKCDSNSHTLSNFHRKMQIKAKNGAAGEGLNMAGKSGGKTVIAVPPGTQIIELESGRLVVDMLEDGQEFLYLKGGKGGLGNVHFKSSTNQRPTYAQPGEMGITKEIRLELKLIADVGLVGFPNVGKSTLISTLSNAKPEIANYEFTTLTPKLGQVDIGDYESFIMADIPGIIGGASTGKGLGIQFLRHIERTKILLFMIDLASYRDLREQYFTLKEELLAFSELLAGSKYAIALTRCDVLETEAVNELVGSFLDMVGVSKTLKNDLDFDADLVYFIQDTPETELGFDGTKPYFIAPISSATHKNITPLKHALFNLVQAERRA